MRFAALETSTEWCSVALWLDGEIRALEQRAGERHAELALRNREATIGVRLVADAQRLQREVAELSSRSPERGDPASAAAPATQAAPPPRA